MSVIMFASDRHVPGRCGGFPVMFYAVRDGGGILFELKKVNWAPFVLGFVIDGFEVGFIYAYKASWQVSAAQVVAASAFTLVLIVVGYLGYGEPITWSKIVGVIVCLVGLGLINLN